MKIQDLILAKKGEKLSEEMKKKLSKAGKGRIVSEETRKKNSEAHKGQVPWNKGKKTGHIPWNKGKQNLLSEETRKKMGYWKGKKHSEETRKKISKSNKGKKFSEEHRKKLSKSATGRILSEEHRKKMSERMKGKPGLHLGMKHSEESKKKMSAANTGKKDSEETIKRKKRAQSTPEAIQRKSDSRAKQKFPFKDTKPELLTHSILEKHNISFKKHKNFKLYKSHHQADIVIEPNHVIEVFGDYWHFNPKKFDGESTQKKRRKEIKAKDVWKRDKYVIDGMKEQGYKVLVVWESELKKELQKTTQKILKFIKVQILSKNDSFVCILGTDLLSNIILY